MTSRNFLKAGNLVEPIPLGILLSVKYQPSGSIQSVDAKFSTDDESDPTLNKQCLDILTSKKLVPNSILTQNGTVSVLGVLTIDRPTVVCGDIPYAQYSKIADLASSSSCSCKFYALDAECTNIILANGVYTRNWLKFQKFELLPGVTLPLNKHEEVLDNAVLNSEIRYSSIIGYYSFSKSERIMNLLHYHLAQVSRINDYLDESGYLHTNIECRYSEINDFITLNTSYYESIIKFNLKVGDYIIIDENNAIVMKYYGTDHKQNSDEYTCKVCGRKYEVLDDFTVCPNTRCMSHTYDDVYHLLSVFGVSRGKILSYNEYKDLVNAKNIEKLSDVLKLDAYSGTQFSLSFYNILDACISEELLRDRKPIWELCEACNHSYYSIMHYIDNPQDISSDLHVYDTHLISWLKDNADIVKEICELPNVNIVESAKKFEGAPIFRDKNICITGTFRHGSLSDVSSILMSYSANITSYKNCDVVLVGDIKENVDGRAINFAKAHNITIMNESDFFALYEIDDDLSKLDNSK